MLKNPAYPAASRGFSLIELMIAMTLGLVMIAALGGMFTGSNQAYRQDEAATRMQDELRYAMSQIVRDVEMAGYWTEMFQPSAINAAAALLLPISKDCGPTGTPWVYANLGQSLAAGDNLTASEGPSKFACITSGTFQANTDVLAIRRVAGRLTAGTNGVGTADCDRNGATDTAVSGLASGRVYLRVANGQSGTLMVAPEASTPSAGTTWCYYEYQPTVYYIRNFSVTSGDGIPSLCRATLGTESGTPKMESECFATGIENLQVEFGVDSDVVDPTLGADQRAQLIHTPNMFLSNPTATQLSRTVAMRISLLARSENSDSNYKNEKTYTIANLAPASPNDHYYRKVASSLVILRNPSAQIFFASLEN